MELKSIEIENFKKIVKAHIEPESITVLVGGNDSGKSSFIQAMHFGITTANSYHQAGKKTFPQERLLYCPTHPFFRLSNKSEYQNQSNFYFCRLTFLDDNQKEIKQIIKIYRAKNDNVGFEYERSNAEVSREISSDKRLYSVFAPGVSGIPIAERLYHKSEIKRGVASGEANLYLRSVLYKIQQEQKLPELTRLVKLVFPDFYIACTFNEEHDTSIKVVVSTAKGGIPTVPLELAATGVLQILQIFAYVTLFSPRILLLDEPDAHIHPDRQVTLALALKRLTQNTDTKIILTTHSKHLIAALSDVARFYGFRDGGAHLLDGEKSWLPIAQELGLTSSLEQIGAGKISHLVITEDSEKKYIKHLLKSNGFKLEKCLFSSYSSSSQLPSALHLAHWVKERFPDTKIIIHRDKDVFSDEEIDLLKKKNDHHSFKWFVTKGTDIESYFCDPKVVAEIGKVTLQQAQELIDEARNEHHNDFVAQFTKKRTDAAPFLKKLCDGEKPPEPKQLPKEIPLPVDCIVGKNLLKSIRIKLREKYQKRLIVSDHTQATIALKLDQLAGLL